MTLVRRWGAWDPTGPPYFFPGDTGVFQEARSASRIITHFSWAEAKAASDFCKPGDARLHLGLLPIPFVGDLRRASIYILLLNPGVGPHDYFGEYEVPQYRAALLRNLRQEFTASDLPFLFLDPAHSWHGGFAWWHAKLAAVIQQLAARREISFASARAALATELACLELMPYHSATFRDGGRWLQRLPSVALARTFVKEVVLPRVMRDEAIVIVTRQPALWELPEHPRVIRYSGQQARAAHLTPGSPGGRAILRQLGADT